MPALTGLPAGRLEKISLGENFFLHWPAVSPISHLTRREKKPDEAA
jgi:hypothetical protein